MLVVRRNLEPSWPAAEMDLERHRRRLAEAIRRNLPDLIAEERIVFTSGEQVVRVPIRVLEEFRLRFDYRSGRHVGQGSGNTRKGQVLDVACLDGTGGGPGDQPGFDYYEEAETTLEELSSLLYEDLGLANLQQKQDGSQEQGGRWQDLSLSGPMGTLDRRRTLLANLYRNALEGRPALGPFNRADLRFRRCREDTQPSFRAAVIAMMDTSGSMGAMERYLARTFFFWALRLLRLKYGQIEVVFIAHHAEAREVTETEFFSRGPCGGTRCSSAYRLALQIIEERYPPSLFNLYPLHFSDGDNLPSDNEECLRLVQKLLAVCNQVAYGEVSGSFMRGATLGRLYRQIEEPRLVTFFLQDKADLYPALKQYFGANRGESGRYPASS